MGLIWSKSQKGVILNLLIDCHFGNLLWEFESELAMVANIKVVHFYVLIESVQKDWEV